MNDMYEKGFNDGKEMGYRDGFARGWHEAMRAKAPQVDTTTRSSMNVCPKCNVTFSGVVSYTCPSWACPMQASGEIKSIHGET